MSTSILSENFTYRNALFKLKWVYALPLGVVGLLMGLNVIRW